MALASGLFARPYVARDSGAPGHFCVCSARVVGAVDDAILLSRWAARLPSLDDARVVVRLCDRLGALPCIDSIAVEWLQGRCRKSIVRGQLPSVTVLESMPKREINGPLQNPILSSTEGAKPIRDAARRRIQALMKASRSSLTWSFIVVQSPCGAPLYTLSFAAGMSFACIRPASAIGTI